MVKEHTSLVLPSFGFSVCNRIGNREAGSTCLVSLVSCLEQAAVARSAFPANQSHCKQDFDKAIRLVDVFVVLSVNFCVATRCLNSHLL
jgi:hypothetical protein